MDGSFCVSCTFRTQLYRADPLPQHICPSCRDEVNDAYDRLSAFRRQHALRMHRLRSANAAHPYLQACRLAEVRIYPCIIYFSLLTLYFRRTSNSN